jgi:hypothetical protein
MGAGRERIDGNVRPGKRQHTILDVAVLDLLQHLGPHSGMRLLVLVDELGLQLHDLGEPPAWILCPSW